MRASRRPESATPAFVPGASPSLEAKVQETVGGPAEFIRSYDVETHVYDTKWRGVVHAFRATDAPDVVCFAIEHPRPNGAREVFTFVRDVEASGPTGAARMMLLHVRQQLRRS